MNNFRLSLYALLLAVCFAVTPGVTEASEITIRPFLIDETLEPRGVAVNTVTLKSDYPVRKAILYATVNEITIDQAGEIKEFISPVMTDRTNTVTSWIEVSRARIAIMPGETAEIPITLRIHPYAEPGEYHAFIGFVEAPNRPKAEAIALAGDARGVLLKVTIADQRSESMRIASFLIDRFVTGSSETREIDIRVENSGDLPSAPVGEIIFYDSKGVEVGSAPVNTEGVVIAPGETATLKSEVPIEGSLGRFKANVALKYGEQQRAALYDTTFFYHMPLHVLLLLFGVILTIAIVIALLFRRAFSGHDEYDDCQEVTMYVRDGHEPQPKDHDIDLKNQS